MKKAINRNKLKIKYFLNIQSLTNLYPNDEDYLYELISTLEAKDLLEKEFTIAMIKQDVHALKNRTQNGHYKILEKLVNVGFLEMTYKGKVSKTSRFKVKTHPWI